MAPTWGPHGGVPFEQLWAWYHSEEYAPLKALRRQHMRIDFMLVDGLRDDEIEQVIGYSAELKDGGVFGFGIRRAEPIAIPDWGLEEVPAVMGVANAINVQPLGEGEAAITGDFVLIAAEVNSVAQALSEHGIEVHALHNHFLTEEPRLFYMHFFATGDPVELARGLRAALDHVNVAPPEEPGADATPIPNGEFPEGTPAP